MAIRVRRWASAAVLALAITSLLAPLASLGRPAPGPATPPADAAVAASAPGPAAATAAPPVSLSARKIYEQARPALV